MKKKRSERKTVESSATRWTRTRTRQQQDEEPAVARIEPLDLLKESPLGRSGLVVRRDPDVQSREMDPSLEETLLAFLDTNGVREADDIEEDKLTFLDATYARCGVRVDASVPTQKMFQAIYRNAQESQSVELTMASFQLLKDLETRHPRVAVAEEEADDSPGLTTRRLDIDRRVWSPIEDIIEDMASADRMLPDISPEEPIPLNLLTLVGTIAMDVPEEGSQLVDGVSSVAFNSHNGVKIAGQFLMLQHLISLIQRDLCCCVDVYEATMDTSAVQKSSLYRLICALPTDFRKTFLSNLIFLLKPRGEPTEIDEGVPSGEGGDLCLGNGRDAEASDRRGLLPCTSDFSRLAYRLLLMIMEIDHVTRKGNAGSSRQLRRGSFPDDLSSMFNDARDLEAYLEALDSPLTKLRFIVDYFVANAPPDIVGKGLKDSIDKDTIDKLLACFIKPAKFVHKFGEDVLPVLLAHSFQAFLLLHVEAACEVQENEQVYQAKLLDVSRRLVDTLNELRALERQTQMLPVAEHAIQMAESIVMSS